ncbi:hypothetical protein QQ045_017792 [Rhodiola kirilowii]
MIKSVTLIFIFALAALVLHKAAEHVENVALRIRTVAGHNMKPTPWHWFPPKTFDDESRIGQASKIITCSYLKCTTSSRPVPKIWNQPKLQPQQCPDFFKRIHRDLEPWPKTNISVNHLMKAKEFAAFR